MKRKSFVLVLFILSCLLLASCAVFPGSAAGTENTAGRENAARSGNVLDISSDGGSVLGQAAGVSEEAPLLTIGGREVSGWRYLYWLALTGDKIRERYRAEEKTPDWNAPTDGFETLGAYAKEQALMDAALYAAVETFAERYGVEWTDADAAAVAARWQSRCRSYGSESAYLRELSRFGLDQARAAELSRVGQLYEKLSASCRNGGSLTPPEAELEALEQESGAVRVDRILSAGSDRNAARAKAVDCFLRLNGADDQAALFARLAAAGDDPAGPRTLGEGTLDGTLTAVSRVLEVGELSGVIESEAGFSILRRLPPDMAELSETWLDRKLQEEAETAEIRLTARYAALDAGAFLTALDQLREEN